MTCKHWEEKLNDPDFEWERVPDDDDMKKYGARIRCKEEPNYYMSDPVCAFDEEGNFVPDNWGCLLMNELRKFVGDATFVSEDHTLAVIPWGTRFIILSYYKNRGKTDGFWIIEGEYIREGKEKDIKKFLKEKEELME